MLINNSCNGFLIIDCGEFIGKIGAYMQVMPVPIRSDYRIKVGQHTIDLENIINIRKNQGFINEFDGRLFFAGVLGYRYYFININNKLVCLTDMKTYFVPNIVENREELSSISRIPNLGSYSMTLKTYPLV